MTDISPAVQPAPEPLEGLVVGDAALAAPRAHGLPGRLFIGFTFLMVFASALQVLTVIFLATSESGLSGGIWQRGLASCVWAVLQWRLAGEVGRFSRWGWYGAMAELAAAAALKIVSTVIVPEFAVWFLAVLAIEAWLLRYFWKRRADFGIDFAA